MKDTKEVIEAGNKLIANSNFCPDFVKLNIDHYKESGNDYMLDAYMADLKFHSSFDWLMPVVEKIETMGYGFHKDPFDLNVIEYLSGEEKQIVAYQNDTDEKLIDKWYYVVVQFIKFYNSQSQNQNKR